jgi:hypothetical protein
MKNQLHALNMKNVMPAISSLQYDFADRGFQLWQELLNFRG